MKKSPILAIQPDEVVTNIRSFGGAVEKSPTLQARLSNMRAWYAIPERSGRWQFAPSKWAGYSGMTATEYEAHARENMDGKLTEKRLNRWFRPMKPGTPEHVELLKQLAAFTTRYGKQPSAACRIAVVDDSKDADEQSDDLSELIVRVARRLDPQQRRHIREALRD